jgi:serine/threonine-protein kinase HipA
MVFNIAISNTDDHLRNHGFLLNKTGWQLSPAYDINPSIDKDGLSLNIDSDSNALDFDLAMSVGEYFQLKETEMVAILSEIKAVVKSWKAEASKIGISKAEMTLMSSAFKFGN